MITQHNATREDWNKSFGTPATRGAISNAIFDRLELNSFVVTQEFHAQKPAPVRAPAP